DQALRAYREPSPLPMVTVWFQQGLLWEQQENRERAGYYYQRAYERFPHYAPLISHRAALEARSGDRQLAIYWLRSLIRQATDPEYLGQLAQLLRDVGETAESEELLARARSSYERLLARYPLAFADHAARFYLGIGADSKRALALA